MRPALALALAALSLLASAAPASAGLQDRVDSAGLFLLDAVAAFGRLDVPGMYGATDDYAERELGAARDTADGTVAFADGELRSFGPLGEAAGKTAADVLDQANQAGDGYAQAARHAANTCGQGLFPVLGPAWEFVRSACLAQRRVAEAIAGPLPPL